MTLIFGGIDFPVFEMMFLVSFLLIIGLCITIMMIFYVLKELKTLKQLLNQEETYMTKFENGITQLEKFEAKETGSKKETNKELFNYIKENLDKGFKWEIIKKTLIVQNWSEEVLEKIYNEVESK